MKTKFSFTKPLLEALAIQDQGRVIYHDAHKLLKLDIELPFEVFRLASLKTLF